MRAARKFPSRGRRVHAYADWRRDAARGCTETVAFGILLHDIAKPKCRAVVGDKVTFYGHTEDGAVMAANMLARLKRSRAVQERVAYLVKNHLKLCMAPRMRPATLKRMLAEDGFDELMDVAFMDAMASSSYLGYWHFCRRAMTTMTAAEIRPPRLIGGEDLKQLGFTPGPRFKEILKDVEDHQLDGALETREAALEYVRAHYGVNAALVAPRNRHNQAFRPYARARRRRFRGASR